MTKSSLMVEMLVVYDVLQLLQLKLLVVLWLATDGRMIVR